MTQIFVGNLAYGTSERELRSAFETYGNVSSVRMVSDHQTGKSRGFAFVAMPYWVDADEAITRLNGTTVAGRQLVVNEAHGNSNPISSPRAPHAVDSFWSRL